MREFTLLLVVEVPEEKDGRGSTWFEADGSVYNDLTGDSYGTVLEFLEHQIGRDLQVMKLKSVEIADPLELLGRVK